MHGESYLAARTIVSAAGDTLVKDSKVFYSDKGPATQIGAQIAQAGQTINIDGNPVTLSAPAKVADYLATLKGSVKFSSGQSVARDHNTGKIEVMEKEDVTIPNVQAAKYETHKDLDTSSKQYNSAGDWVGILFAVQAMGSVLWAVVLPRFRSRKFSYALSLLLAGVGFVLSGIITDKYMLFIPFLLIGCGWAAMLAWPFTILTNSLKGGNIGAYLGLFNGSITIPQIVAAITGGWILSAFSTPGEIAPQYIMMIIAGISMGIGALCVGFIKEGKEETPVKENIPVSEDI
ncbi:MAG: SLC45 family MFS transporter [Bacteroidales bacterium]|nr:SLC45 family MFS transporter [Bacteroidales bacterium]